MKKDMLQTAFKTLVNVPAYLTLDEWKSGNITALRHYSSRKIRKYLSKQTPDERATLFARVQQARADKLRIVLSGFDTEQLSTFFLNAMEAYPHLRSQLFADDMEVAA